MSLDLTELQATHGHAMVDAALRQTLVIQGVIAEHDSILTAGTLGGSILGEIDPPKLLVVLTGLEKVGRPLEPEPAEAGAVSTLGTPVGILGNPPGTDVAYAGGWHFDQDNDWDAWFTIVPILTGGYRVASPASRLTGEHGAAMRGNDATAYLLDDGRIYFEIDWHNHTRGAYSGGFGPDGVLRGQTGGAVNWVGSRMPLSSVVVPAAAQPVISVSSVPNSSDNGYNVVVGGAGFRAEVRFEVQGRVIGEGVSHDWGLYAEGQTDVFGGFEATFGVVKPVGYSYVFRALVETSGLTGEVGI